MLLLDSKNSVPVVCPKLCQDQVQYEYSLRVKEDIEGKYFKWEIYELSARVIEDDLEKRILRNRIMCALTNDKKYTNDSKSIGREFLK